MLALHQDHVRQVLGNARFLLSRRRDVEMINEAIVTASAAANHAMSVWDSAGKGFCAETVAFDLANVATRRIHDIRTNSGKNGPIEFTFPVDIGDYTFVMRASQSHRGGDIVAKVVRREPHESDDGGFNEMLAKHVASGGRIVVIDETGRLQEIVGLPFEERKW
jgi:hypothetical protein